MKKRWIKFTGKAPKFTDPAEAVFDIMIDPDSKLVIGNCIWALTAAVDGNGNPYCHEGFHSITEFGNVPIAKDCITHWRRA